MSEWERIEPYTEIKPKRIAIVSYNSNVRAIATNVENQPTM